jgi:tetratricopeptide (TPR) repeat protein
VGLSQLHLGRLDEAFGTFGRLNDEEPAAALLNNLGIVQLRRDWTPQTGRPAYFFDRAVRSEPTDGDYCFNLGYAYWLERDYQAAIYWLREAVRRNPADGDAHYVLGASLQAAGSTAEAAREHDLARRLSSKYDEWARRPGASANPVPRGLGRVRHDLQTPRAVSLESAIVSGLARERQELILFHLERGRRLFEEERDQEAIGELRRSIFLSPYQAEAQLMLGRVYLRTGRTRDAIDALRIALWIEESADAHAVLGEAHLQENDVAAARLEAERALALDPTSELVKALVDRLARIEPR